MEYINNRQLEVEHVGEGSSPALDKLCLMMMFLRVLVDAVSHFRGQIFNLFNSVAYEHFYVFFLRCESLLHFYSI